MTAFRFQLLFGQKYKMEFCNFRYLQRGCTRYFSSKESDKKLPSSRLSQEQKQKGSLRDPLQDDISNFAAVDNDLKNLGMSDQDRLAVYTTIASVLHLGNIDFEDDPDDNRGGCRVTEVSEKSLQVTAELMGLDSDELRRALTARVMQAAKGGYKGTVIMVPLKVHEASNARDALAKAIYSRLFDYIVGQINASIPFQVKYFLMLSAVQDFISSHSLMVFVMSFLRLVCVR